MDGLDRKIDRKIRDTLNSVPGYRGYRSLEDRRDDDRRVRETISTEISASAAYLTSAGSKAVEARKLNQVSAIERLVGNTRHLADRVRSATYGYGGLFGSRDVSAAVLDQMKQFDDAFLTEAASLQELGQTIANATPGEANLEAYEQELDRLQRLFTERSRIVDTAEPSRDAEVLNLLEPPAPLALSPVVGLARGDAFSILGENYLVDALVIIGEGDQRLVLARVGENDKGQTEWLLGGNTASVPTARLVQTSTTVPATTSTPRRGEATIVTASDTQRNVPIQYDVAPGSGNDVTFWYTIGTETRVLSGSSVVDDDIVIYGQA